MELRETRKMLLREGKTLLYLTVNGGFIYQAMQQCRTLLPQLMQVCGDNLWVGFGNSQVNEPVKATRVMKAIEDNLLHEFIMSVGPVGGMLNLNEILKEMAMYHNYQDVDNLIFISSYTNSANIDTATKRWINRRCFIAASTRDSDHAFAELYFEGFAYLLYNGKVMDEARLLFTLQFAQLD